RWALLPELDTDPTRRAHAAAEHLLDRHGVVTRGAVASERIPGGFAAVYKVLAAFEDSGRCRRGYFVAGLGAAQFGTVGAIDRLRTFSEPTTGPDAAPTSSSDAEVVSVALAATDPANPYGAALPWPERSSGEEGSAGHRPGRKAGALVVIVDGRLVLYVERGGKTLLTFSDDPELLGLAARSLAEAAGRGALGRMTVEKADGEPLLGSGTTPLRTALTEAGFVSTPRGLRLHSGPGRR
ncbi:MAG: DEAD/DEAH box helicase, partial [Actinobacteria bacterium]|nr:DEAD/DEAH box helicase [Actinomycetota bacterium]